MAKMTVNGFGLFNAQLQELAEKADDINRGALGEGAGYVADEISKALDAMPCRKYEYTVKDHPQAGPTDSEKEQIIANFGISPFRSDGGSIETSIGFTGYVKTKSAKFNDNVPTGMLMQCIEYGTEFRQGTHTISNAIRSINKKITETMQKYIDDRINEITE